MVSEGVFAVVLEIRIRPLDRLIEIATNAFGIGERCEHLAADSVVRIKTTTDKTNSQSHGRFVIGNRLNIAALNALPVDFLLHVGEVPRPSCAATPREGVLDGDLEFSDTHVTYRLENVCTAEIIKSPKPMMKSPRSIIRHTFILIMPTKGWVKKDSLTTTGH